jgi:hypothetical protein
MVKKHPITKHPKLHSLQLAHSYFHCTFQLCALQSASWHPWPNITHAMIKQQSFTWVVIHTHDQTQKPRFFQAQNLKIERLVIGPLLNSDHKMVVFQWGGVSSTWYGCSDIGLWSQTCLLTLVHSSLKPLCGALKIFLFPRLVLKLLGV